MVRLSVVIISFNEEKDIGRCIESVIDAADEILVVDSLSTDRTPEICKSFGVRFISHPWEGYINQKNYALSQAKYDHVLSLDADESLSEQMLSEIKRIKDDWIHDGYIFNRRNHYCGRWMKFTTAYPDRKLRLFNRKKGKWTGYDPHDHVEMEAGSSVKRIKADILHRAMEDIQEQKRKTLQFAKVAAKAYADQGRKPWPGQCLVHATWRFLREYFLRLGIFDAKQGLWFSWYAAKYTYLKYSMIKTYKQDG